jgi:anti-sigma B factor antagonist
MQSQATTRQAGNVAVVDLSGNITGSAGLIRKAIEGLVAAGQKNVILNIEHVTYMDSAGMGELVEACTTVRKIGGNLKLANPQARISRLLEMTKLNTVLSIFADEQAALKSF